MLGWTWRFGNAVLSKHPIEHAEVVNLPGYAAWETALVGQKRAVACDINVDSAKICVVGAHLSYRSESIRVQSAREILRLASTRTLPTFVLGDLNSTPIGFPNAKTDAQGNNAIAVFDESDAFGRHDAGQLPAAQSLTFPADLPNQIIDWILIPKQWRLDDYRAIDSTLSDHRPVTAAISWTNNAKTEP